MAEQKKTTITVDDVDYIYEEMTQEQQALVNHLTDLDRKIATSQFNLVQLNVGKQKFVELLKEALAAKPEEE